MPDFLMPALGADMETGKVVAWHVRAGDHVKAGDVVAVVETHKGAIDVEIFLDGVIEDLAQLNVELPVGARLAHVRSAQEGAAPAGPAATVRATPAARARAQELGIALEGMRGSGPQDGIVLRDVEAAAASRPAQTGPAPVARGFDQAQMRAAIASAMSRSKREIPHYYLAREMNFGPATDWLAHYNAGRPPAERLLPAALLLKAAADALAKVPQLNGFWRDGAVQLSSRVHVGWAIALRGGGLVAPAVHDADRLGIAAAMAALRDLVQRARGGGLRGSELTDATVTVTSLGERGADEVFGVIYPPQLAVLGFGRIAPRPWALEGQMVVRPTVRASLAGDHRGGDGHVGSLLLAAIAQALLHPEGLEEGAR